MMERVVGSRPDPVNVALAAVADARNSGIIFVGPVGSGKTSSLRHAVRAIKGIQKPGLRHILVANRSPTRREVGDLPLSGGQGAGRTRSIVAADDLDTWGPRALRRLADALDRRQVQLIGTVRTEGIPQVMGHLRPAPSPALVTLEPWTRSDLSAHAQRALDAPLDALSSAALVRFSGGNPLCLVELLNLGRSTNRLRRRYECWAWAGPMEVPPVTFARVWDVLARIPAEVLDIVLVLGELRQVPVATLLKVFPSELLEEADALHLVSLSSVDATGAASLRRPLDGQVALAAIPALRRRAVMDNIVTAWNTATTVPGYEAEVANACLELGLPVPQHLLAVAEVQVVGRHDVDLARRLCAVGAPTTRSTKILLTSMLDQLRLTEAVALVDPIATPTDATEQQALLAALAAMSSGTSLEVNGSSVSAVICALCVDVWNGARLAVAYDTARGLLGTQLDGWHYECCLVAAVAAAVQLGRVDEGLMLAEAVDHKRMDRFAPPLRLALTTLVGLCHLFRGSVRDSIRVANSLSHNGVEDSWPLACAVGTLLGGRCALAEGRPQLASLRLSESIVASTHLPPGPTRMLALESISVAYVLSDRPGDADAAQDDAAREQRSGAPLLLVTLADLTRGEFLQVEGQSTLAVALGREIAARERAAGRPLTTLLAWHLVARIQDSGEVADALQAAADMCDFDLATTYAQHAGAVHAGDPVRLEEVAKVYDDYGLAWLAAETAAAALAMAEEGRSVAGWALEAKRLVGQLSDQEAVSVPRWWGSVAERVTPLTAREREIAEAVMRGATSAQVAAQLNLSRRTVENHLQHVFRKLGITRRAELPVRLKRMERNPPAYGVERT